MWCIPPQHDAAFVCAMEQVLGVYTRPYDAAHPVICMDETTKQCVREVRTPLPMLPGHPARYDAEYERNGVGHLLMYYAPFDDWRRTDVAIDHTASTDVGRRRAPLGGRRFSTGAADHAGLGQLEHA